MDRNSPRKNGRIEPMSADRFEYEVSSEEWHCVYCGKEKAPDCEPGQAECCGEIGHMTQEKKSER